MLTTLDIFIIDDHADTRRAMIRLLTTQGYRADGASNGAEGLMRLKDISPRLIVLDRMMPGMDGRQLLNHIRQDSRLKDVPAIEYSAALEPPSPEEAARLGICASIPKAAGWDELLENIRRCLAPSK